jgi:hypothetical protein
MRLDEHGIANSGVVEMNTSPILNFKDPDGIALAIAVPTSALTDSTVPLARVKGPSQPSRPWRSKCSRMLWGWNANVR